MNIAQTLLSTNLQRNESLNSVVGSKNPKIRFYGGSESNDYRVSCCVSHVNLGYRYIPQTLAALNIEPGFFCLDHTTKMDKKRALDKQRKSTVAFKRRRSQLNKNKISETSKKETKEGTMYESGIGLNLNSSATAMDSQLSLTELYAINAITKQQQEQYENAVPKYTSRPTVQKEKFDDSKFYHFVQRENQQKYASSLPWIGQTNNSHAIFYQTET